MTTDAVAVGRRPGLARCPNIVLADLVASTRARTVLLVLAGAGFVGALAQISVPLPFTPVPITMQPFAALLVGAALGWRRGGGALVVYLAAGLAGLPWYAGHGAGLSVLLSATGGYLVGFVLAAAAVGALARSGGDRTALRTFVTMLAGSMLIYAVGVPWLMADLHVGLTRGLTLGVAPFWLGDLLKAALGAMLLPGTWAFLRRERR
jgi:biotin transport system substrate-specific component